MSTPNTREPDVLVVGGGPTGLAAACAAADSGADVVLVDRDAKLGGILNQCVHDGFGLEWFGESLTGPEYAARLAAETSDTPARILSNSIVLSINAERRCSILTPDGYEQMQPRSVVLAMGCRERSFGALAVPSSRPAGIYSAGAAQRMINIDGLMVGRRAVVLGSGDIGLIMARRMVLEGAEVAGVVERLPFVGGLARNVSQCLNDFDIPLLLGHTVVEVLGTNRVMGVVVAPVGPNGRPLPSDHQVIACDTLLVSVGLIPENELTQGAGACLDSRTGGPMVDARLMTTVPGVFACGNVLHVHDLADWASLEGQRAGALAARYAAQPWDTSPGVTIHTSPGIRYAVPQTLEYGKATQLHFRVTEPRHAVRVTVAFDGTVVVAKRFAYLAPSSLVRIDLPPITEGVSRVEVSLG